MTWKTIGIFLTEQRSVSSSKRGNLSYETGLSDTEVGRGPLVNRTQEEVKVRKGIIDPLTHMDSLDIG